MTLNKNIMVYSLLATVAGNFGAYASNEKSNPSFKEKVEHFVTSTACKYAKEPDAVIERMMEASQIVDIGPEAQVAAAIQHNRALAVKQYKDSCKDK